MKKILWIDDNEDLIDASIPTFQKNGFLVIKATNTSRALSILRDNELDGVLLDVRLQGGENGLELLKELRRLYPTLKVAIFTGYPEYDDHVDAEEIGASAYLSKIRKTFPLDPDKQRRFFQSLDKVFSSKRNAKHYPAKKPIAITLLVLGVIISLVANVATSTLPEILRPYLWLSWPLLFFLILISIFLLLRE